MNETEKSKAWNYCFKLFLSFHNCPPDLLASVLDSCLSFHINLLMLWDTGAFILALCKLSNMIHSSGSTSNLCICVSSLKLNWPQTQKCSMQFGTASCSLLRGLRLSIHLINKNYSNKANLRWLRRNPSLI